ncbi:helix-turn-helix domain-containing protein [Microbacterium sp. 77mftsu3.1]|uniref:helix-turn-helix domain-containing protein n=1 Tax=Microbacterium sp. 77mftsu3.1 TaxID=1761802 RepID=UPI00088F11D8|nr:helix-turn-helix domain-containing protein [Microbacterium sp. 77mftsu3.1]SDG22945.1 Helix-turn-helix domain-containing protein [Microbacterium sp. 77mftsu3.1]
MSRAEGFAAVPTWMIRDTRVSVHAIAVFASLASRAGFEEIHPSQTTLATEARCSERKVRDALNELEQLGVIRRERRTSSVGRASNGYTLHPNGRPPGVPASPAGTYSVPARTTEVPARGAAGSGTSEQITPLIEVENLEVDNSQVDRAFEALWNLWPTPRRSTRKVVEKSLRAALKAASWSTIESAARDHVLVWQTWPAGDINFVPLLSTWLNQERWSGARPLPRSGGRLSVVDAGRAADMLLAQHEQRAVGA